METEVFLKKIIYDVESDIERNFKIFNRLYRKYKNIHESFYDDEENDDLYDLLFDISMEFKITEETIYDLYIRSKYDYYGEISRTLTEDFINQITITRTLIQNL